MITFGAGKNLTDVHHNSGHREFGPEQAGAESEPMFARSSSGNMDSPEFVSEAHPL